MYIQNEPKFNGVYLRNNLPKIKDGAYVTNFDEYKSIETHWKVNPNNMAYFVSLGVENIPKEVKKFIENKNIEYKHSVICGYFCIGFINFMLEGVSLLN